MSLSGAGGVKTSRLRNKQEFTKGKIRMNAIFTVNPQTSQYSLSSHPFIWAEEVKENCKNQNNVWWVETQGEIQGYVENTTLLQAAIAVATLFDPSVKDRMPPSLLTEEDVCRRAEKLGISVIGFDSDRG